MGVSNSCDEIAIRNISYIRAFFDGDITHKKDAETSKKKESNLQYLRLKHESTSLFFWPLDLWTRKSPNKSQD